MVVVLGSVLLAEEQVAAALELSLEHVNRSRGEPGCISHRVSIDAEQKHRLNFHEEWESMSDLHRHFGVAASVAFVAALSEMALEAPSLQVYEATRVR
ncbi:MAG: antibiotic biosynthesis monooxygenase [Pseudomonadota bacterium]